MQLDVLSGYQTCYVLYVHLVCVDLQVLSSGVMLVLQRV
jgi:hypothetical protein